MTSTQELTHREAAEQWMDENPDVYAMFERFALQMAERRRRFGIGLLAERVRWETFLLWPSTDYKINNNHRAYIARRLIADHPELDDLIQRRRTRC